MTAYYRGGGLLFYLQIHYVAFLLFYIQDLNCIQKDLEMTTLALPLLLTLFTIDLSLKVI